MKGNVYISQISTAGALQSDSLMSYLGHSLGGKVLVLLLFRDAVDVFYSSYWLDYEVEKEIRIVVS